MTNFQTLALCCAVSAATAATVTTFVDYVQLQAATPGTAQTGHLNINGTAIVGKLRAGLTSSIGALVKVSDTGAVGGVSSSSTADAIYGGNTSTSGAYAGGKFASSSTSGRGVLGTSTSTTGSTRGGLFQSASTTGVGCYGLSSATSGTGVGVTGAASSSTGIGITALNPKLGQSVELAGPHGAVNVGTGQVVKSYDSNAVETLPIAMGNITFDGTILGGTGNFTCTYDSGTKRYLFTISGETVNDTNYVTVVTGTTGSWDFFAGASSGQLAIVAYNSLGNRDTATFHFVVYKVPSGSMPPSYSGPTKN